MFQILSIFPEKKQNGNHVNQNICIKEILHKIQKITPNNNLLYGGCIKLVLNKDLDFTRLNFKSFLHNKNSRLKICLSRNVLPPPPQNKRQCFSLKKKNKLLFNKQFEYDFSLTSESLLLLRCVLSMRKVILSFSSAMSESY